jgi:hypothetical protein
VPPWEVELLSLEKVCTYLAQGQWFRGVRSNGFFGLGAYQYYLGKHLAQHRVALRFDPEAMVLICLPEGCLRDHSTAHPRDHESRVDG